MFEAMLLVEAHFVFSHFFMVKKVSCKKFSNQTTYENTQHLSRNLL